MSKKNNAGFAERIHHSLQTPSPHTHQTCPDRMGKETGLEWHFSVNSPLHTDFANKPVERCAPLKPVTSEFAIARDFWVCVLIFNFYIFVFYLFKFFNFFSISFIVNGKIKLFCGDKNNVPVVDFLNTLRNYEYAEHFVTLNY